MLLGAVHETRAVEPLVIEDAGFRGALAGMRNTPAALGVDTFPAPAALVAVTVKV